MSILFSQQISEGHLQCKRTSSAEIQIYVNSTLLTKVSGIPLKTLAVLPQQAFAKAMGNYRVTRCDLSEKTIKFSSFCAMGQRANNTPLFSLSVDSSRSVVPNNRTLRIQERFEKRLGAIITGHENGEIEDDVYNANVELLHTRRKLIHQPDHQCC